MGKEKLSPWGKLKSDWRETIAKANKDIKNLQIKSAMEVMRQEDAVLEIKSLARAELDKETNQ